MTSVDLICPFIHAWIRSFNKYSLNFHHGQGMVSDSNETTEHKSITASTLMKPTFQKASIKRVKQGEKVIAHLERCTEGKNVGYFK